MTEVDLAADHALSEAAALASKSAKEEQRTSYLELFFDLVVVLAITQVSTLIVDDPTAAGFGRAALMLAMIWWAWSGYAWMTNAIDIDSLLIRLVFLAGMGAMFFMALAVPKAYGGQGLWFVVPYLLVRMIQLVIHPLGVRDDREHLAALMKLIPWFAVAPVVALVGGFVHGDARVALWSASLAIDVVGALSLGGENDFRVSPGHFAERYELFVIIALGESIVAIGVGAANDPRNATFALAVSIAFAGAVALWWSYFDFVATGAERALRFAEPRKRGPLARDLFTLGHFPLVLGVVLFAVAAKKTLLDPTHPLSGAGRASLGLGVALVLLTPVIGRYRVIRKVAWERVVGMAAAPLAVVAVGARLGSMWLIALVTGVLVGVIAAETRRLRHVRRHIRSGGGPIGRAFTPES